ncbi:MAG: glutaredoxin family protein [Gammaproteobacteria bacterium]|nr:glutaredoxin family protein [Pseudomonadota bacterium]MCZ6537264.1 glutaredoxin family protein [Gammaproteobacteria bacterium]MCH8958714.1 glutaredoxin family protein [Pseudomonadota bacterium]MCZ6687934.1 glutaredoxin family protein [Gammaproteobacteria bacterium]MCZ6762131.1 glutaredoxin family protein [Gammaproteobacteria bacterium]
MELVLYSREACGLCDEMLAQLQPLLLSHQASIRVVDIAGDTELMHRFGLRIPVLLCDGEILCEGHLDTDLVAQSLGRHR